MKLIELNGKLACITEHCKDLGISLGSFYQRIKKTGETPEDCLLYYEEKLKKDMIEFNGKVAKIAEHCKDLGVDLNTVRSMHYRTGKPYNECLEHYMCHEVLVRECLIEFNGKIANLSEHCRDLGIKVSTVDARYKRTGESYLKCLEYYQENGVKQYNRDYKIKDKRLYRRWQGAKDRCENPKNPMYYRYGKRGIKVCDRWQVYGNFENDMLESFLKHVEEFGLHDTQIERKDYNGNYEPNNVTWATSKEQANNKSNNVMITKNLNCTQFAEKYNIDAIIVLSRFRLGWTAEEIINTPVKNRTKYYLPCGKSLAQHCKQNNYVYVSVARYTKKYNLSPDEALAKYLEKRNKK